MRKSLTDRVVTGMGSAVPANQKMAGASNPELAAKMAALQEGPLDREEELIQNESLKRKLELIKKAKEDGFDPNCDLDKVFQESPGEVESIFIEMEEWQKKKIDDEIDDLEYKTYSIPSDNPLYEPIKDTDRRRRIEKSLEPLDFESMIFKGYCVQEVEVKENFKITFRTLNTNQSLWIEAMTLQLQDYSVQYGRHWMSLVQLCVCLESINGRAIEPLISRFTKKDQEENFKEALNSRMEYVGQLPQIITDDLIVQYVWFSARVRKLMSGDVVDKLGNS